MTGKPEKRKLLPLRLLSIGYLFLSAAGAFILMLPVSSYSGEYTSFLDALFTSVSGVTTTGLIVVDTGTYFNRFGQTVIMVLFQVGGLGYMLFVALAVLLSGRGLSMSYRIMLRESVNRPSNFDLIKFIKVIIILTLIIELVGFAALAFFLSFYFPPGEAMYSALFHSISAFTTAGFSIYADSFIGFKGDVLFNIIIIALIITGGAGFFVLYDLYSFTVGKKQSGRRRLTTHTKLILSTGLMLNITGILLLFILEGDKFSGSLNERALISIFQSLTASSTAGFNTIDIGSLSLGSLYYLLILMFVGAGPGGTAGGIKLTTFAIILFSVFNEISTKRNLPVFKRSIAFKTIRKAFAIGALSLLWLLFAVLVLSISEEQEFIKSVFEVTSALGTVGLSTGITAGLSISGKIILIITMLIGRIGPLAIGLSVIKQDRLAIRYAEDEVLVG
jgi:trk system potassium uptake protein